MASGPQVSTSPAATSPATSPTGPKRGSVPMLPPLPATPAFSFNASELETLSSPSLAAPSTPPRRTRSPTPPPSPTTLTPSLAARWCARLQAAIQFLPRGTHREEIVIGELLSIAVYRFIGDFDVAYHFYGDASPTSKKQFFEDLSARPKDLVQFFKDLLPINQTRLRVFGNAVFLSDFLAYKNIERQNKAAHDITFKDVAEVLHILRLSNRGRQAAVYETLTAAITNEDFSEAWETNTQLIATAATAARKSDVVSLDEDSEATPDMQKTRRIALQLRSTVKKYEARGEALAVSVFEQKLRGEGWVKTDRMARFDGERHGHRQNAYDHYDGDVGDHYDDVGDHYDDVGEEETTVMHRAVTGPNDGICSGLG
ncbi:hypothetical protein GGX14DRAFT_583979 [Mycena pura]|uniref:Uncharacterized protein n=1 Tax=Mycena pura TaxID=153505 RepID=A0AAD6YVW5_9AGAR|nr:hypothetical protein GGX14DRAFT_583979 [Mycena pura]